MTPITPGEERLNKEYNAIIDNINRLAYAEVQKAKTLSEIIVAYNRTHKYSPAWYLAVKKWDDLSFEQAETAKTLKQLLEVRRNSRINSTGREFIDSKINEELRRLIELYDSQ